MMAAIGDEESVELVLQRLGKTKSNKEFLDTMNKSL
jgi:transcription termination factor Rho